MTDDERRYVVDTNTLSQIGRQRRSSEFFRTFARIPEAVLREAEGFSDIDALMENVLPTTPSVLRCLSRVMATVPDHDTRLVDLYRNLGNADPLVVACALERMEHDSQILFSPEWVIVTGDEAVRAKAAEFELRILSNAEFAALIDSSHHEQELVAV